MGCILGAFLEDRRNVASLSILEFGILRSRVQGCRGLTQRHHIYSASMELGPKRLSSLRF